ncbi:hypothetical protein JMF89_07335 [Clostridiaceae bacterium UIB06]|uniref:VCBS repeat-containing protein n=1 Tax=Clostridium thailandense TaxID=2794346 RepID=A0A949TYM3_9CLOT|nr:hypothetical protein [Clostridium thailandense]MBV7276026.1 hypothetical protein [Clostridium thailandense]MCH5137015.1 hypothetical protein [Clostridiaceae bacterium UIB06]
MKIENSNIQLSGKHSFMSTYSKQESGNAWNNTGRNISSKLKALTNNLEGDEIKLSPGALEFLKKSRELSIEENTQKTESIEISNSDSSIKINLSDDDKRKILLIEGLLSSILHKKVNLQIPDEIKINLSQVDPKTFNSHENLVQNNSLGWGLQYQQHEAFYENEAVSFNSSGTIRTSDGKEINFDLQLNMSRSFYSENNLSIKAGDALIDPLVINYDAPAAQVTSTKFSFDLDSDGKEDQISSLKQGSGFLAIDLNGDGNINNGKELFGTESGNGFEDLAKYDIDKNNWIDENDPVFNKLRIWTKDENGNNQLVALGAKGIGAIYLGNVSAEFSMKDNKNQELAQARNAGIFVKENGEVGTVQQVDFAVENKSEDW